MPACALSKVCAAWGCGAAADAPRGNAETRAERAGATPVVPVDVEGVAGVDDGGAVPTIAA